MKSPHKSIERLAENDYNSVEIIFSAALKVHAEQTEALGLMKLSSDKK